MHGKRWHIEFNTVLRGLCTVDIFQKNYTGSVEIIEKYAEEPMEHPCGESSDDPFKPLKGSSIVLRLIATKRLQFIEMFSADIKKHYAEVKYDGVLDGRYWFVTDLYSEPYNQPPFQVNLTAVDGIGLLKNMDFDLRENHSIKESLLHIFNKLELNLPFDVVCEINEVSSGAVAYLDTLKQFDYLNDNESDAKCDKVLEQLLISMQCRLYQSQGKWVIEQIAELDKAHTISHYTSNFTFISSETIDNSIVTTAAMETNFCKLFVESAELTALPAWKQFELTQNYYKKENALPGGTFKNSSLIFELKGPDKSYSYQAFVDGVWSFVPAVYVGENYYTLDKWYLSAGYMVNSGTSENPILAIGPGDGFVKYLLNNNLNLKQAADIFNIEFKIAVLKSAYTSTEGHYELPGEGDVRIQIKCSLLYLTEENGWSDTESYININNLKSSGVEDLYTISITCGNVPANAPLEIKIWNVDDSSLYNSIHIAGVKVSFLDSQKKKHIENITDTVILDTRNNLIPSSYDLDFVDLPDFPNALNMYSGGMLLPSGWHTKLWQYNGKQDKLAALMVLQYIAGFSVPRFKITCNMYSDIMHFGSILTDIGSGDRKFLMSKGTYSARSSKWNGCEWLELPSYPIQGELEAMFIGSVSDSVLNIYGPNAIDDGEYIIFPELTKDVFDITDPVYWHADFQSLSGFDAGQPRRWKKTWISGPEIIEYALPEVQKYLFFKDIEDGQLQTSMPIMVYSTDQTANQNTIEEFLSGYFWLYDGADLLEDNGSVLFEKI